MIIEYLRPQTIEEALRLLARPQPETRPLAGGTVLNQDRPEPFAVLDLQDLGLDTFGRRGQFLEIGATLRLQALLDNAALEGTGLLPTLRQVIQLEATQNLRNMASVAGTLVAADGRSPFATALLALDASLTILPGDEQADLGDWLPFRRERLSGRLIRSLVIPANARLSFHNVARTPADRSIVCVAAATWPSGRTRVALGGFGGAPTLAFDGTESAGAEIAAASQYSAAGDEWASAEYRSAMAHTLTLRALNDLKDNQ